MDEVNLKEDTFDRSKSNKQMKFSDQPHVIEVVPETDVWHTFVGNGTSDILEHKTPTKANNSSFSYSKQDFSPSFHPYQAVQTPPRKMQYDRDNMLMFNAGFPSESPMSSPTWPHNAMNDYSRFVPNFTDYYQQCQSEIAVTSVPRNSNFNTRSKNSQRYSSCECPNCQEMANKQDSVQTMKSQLHNCHIPGCGKVYSKTSHLKAHLHWHSGERPFLCSFCGKRFSRPDELQRHLCQQHTSEGKKSNKQMETTQGVNLTNQISSTSSKINPGQNTKLAEVPSNVSNVSKGKLKKRK